MSLMLKSQEFQKQALNTGVDIIVVRQPRTENPSGLGIAQILAR